jgi:hypothetical protein
MTSLARQKTFDWYEFLGQWSQDFISSTRYLDQLPESVRESGWLGFPGASEEQIKQTETRLNVTLPPSYRDFLKVSNGWRQTTPFIYRIWPVEEIKWFREKHQNWIRSFSEAQLRNRSEHQKDGHELNGSLKISEISDTEYYLYGEEQDCSKIRLEYLNSAMEISDKGESAVYLLNPEVIFENGEWEAWFFGDWLPGADRYRSFQELMEAEYKNFLEMREIP